MSINKTEMSWLLFTLPKKKPRYDTSKKRTIENVRNKEDNKIKAEKWKLLNTFIYFSCSCMFLLD